MSVLGSVFYYICVKFLISSIMKTESSISHLYFDTEWHIQSNADHCEGVAKIASEFASEFGMGDWGRMLGLLHDRGKESEGFQAHIKRSSDYDCSATSLLPSFHSMAGAKIIHSIGIMDGFFWLSNSIAGHHRGLYNNDELELKMQEENLADVSRDIPSIELKLPENLSSTQDSSHITRMLFSSLVDADRLDTERFMSPQKYAQRKLNSTIHELKEALDRHLEILSAKSAGKLNKIRSDIQNFCRECTTENSGFFSLTVPTGGGKTLSSMVWALNYALKHNKKRIIIAIPFTSIIVQTAAVLKEIFGEDNVIEHHSALNEEKNNDDENTYAHLASQNWDAPIIVTTNVQLFESMYSNRPSACRKLHSICNSIVILDEVQSLPLTYLQPIVEVMASYVRLFNTSFLFSSATQPILTGEHIGSSGKVFNGIKSSEIKEIIPSDYDLHNQLRRVRINFIKEPLNYDDLGQQFSSFNRMLCVVNTRKHALEIFNSLIPLDGVRDFHLSRYMCGAHILSVIDEIKKNLKKGDIGVRVISTQLIEAGVDMDFPVVFRQMSGLDSILQAAGRCNREGKEDKGETYVFSLENEKNIGMMGFAADVMKDIISVHPDIDCFDPASIELYYKKLYSRTPNFDKDDIGRLQANPMKCQYEEVAKRFRLIDEKGINVVVNYGEAEELIERLRYSGPSRKLSRELGRYSVNIPIHLFKSLNSGGLIEEPYKGIYFIPYKEQYDEKRGLKADNDFWEQNFII